MQPQSTGRRVGTQSCHVLVEALLGLVGRVSGKERLSPP